jgi:AraC-like DNA-binding protein
MSSFFWNYDMDPEFPLSILDFVTRGDNEKIHWHNYLQVALCTGGNGKFIFTNREYDVEKGDIFIVSNFENHVALSNLPDVTNYIFVLFLPNLIASPGSSQFDFEYLYPFWYNSKTFNNKIGYATSEAKAIGQAVLEMKEIWDKKEVAYQHELDAYLRRILALLIRYYKITYNEYYSINTNNHTKIQEALYYINQNFDENITLNEIAEILHISESTFRHLFKESLHMSFKEYITYLRLTKARMFLQTTDMSIGEVANNSGYTNINQFYKVFHKYVFMSPAEYRNLYNHKIID